jgi:hypothetical protein
MSHLSINEIVGYNVEGTAEWRRRKALEFPEDSRNLKAAEELDRLATEISELEGSDIHSQIDLLIDNLVSREVDFYSFEEGVSANLRSIGFHGSYRSGAAFLEWYRDELENLLSPHIDSESEQFAEEMFLLFGDALAQPHSPETERKIDEGIERAASLNRQAKNPQ